MTGKQRREPQAHRVRLLKIVEKVELPSSRAFRRSPTEGAGLPEAVRRET